MFIYFEHNYIQFINMISNTLRYDADSMDLLLEKEKNKNKTESWNKLEKSEKINKLHSFANYWSTKNNQSTKIILSLFLLECLEKNKLKNKKDIVYDKESMQIKNIPSLSFENEKFKLITDIKRVSTLKSLTPKRDVNLK